MKIAIIGGAGKMGRWFARFLLQEGKEVAICGRDETKLRQAARQLGVAFASPEAAVKAADMVLLSVPPDSFEDAVRQISPHIKPGQMVLDITSVKAFPVDIMHKHLKKCVVLGTHPMFGPGAESIAHQNFILTPTNAEEEALAQKVKKYLETRAARVALMTPEEHDEIMSVVLGLAHFIALVSGDALLSSGRMEKIGALGGTTYKMLLTLVESVVAEDAALYASLQMNLPQAAAVAELFVQKAHERAGVVAQKDRDGFVRKMSELRRGLEQFDPGFGKAYERMYRLIEGR